MSLINDALKQARQNPPASEHQPMSPLQPVTHQPVSVAGWLIPAIVIFLIVAAIFCIGWALASRSTNTKVATPVAVPAPVVVVAPTPVAAVPAPVVPPPVVISAPAPPPVVTAIKLPVLQGIFYSPTAPSAIVDGKTVHLGDSFNQFRVKEITKSTVTLVDAAGKATKLIMGN